jgi:hypothetical protein
MRHPSEQEERCKEGKQRIVIRERVRSFVLVK